MNTAVSIQCMDYKISWLWNTKIGLLDLTWNWEFIDSFDIARQDGFKTEFIKGYFKNCVETTVSGNIAKIETMSPGFES